MHPFLIILIHFTVTYALEPLSALSVWWKCSAMMGWDAMWHIGSLRLAVVGLFTPW